MVGLVALILVLVGVPVAHSQEGIYQGVSPGGGNPPPKVESIPKGKAMVTWSGFQMLEGGGSRFFIQTTRPVKIETKKSRGRFVLVLKNTRVHLKNNTRPLETEFFDTPVSRATVQRRGRGNAAMVFEMREDVTPTVTREKGKDGYAYILVDFKPTAAQTDLSKPGTPE